MPRTVYEVGQVGADWYVKPRGATRADSIHPTKPPAVSRAVALAKANQPSQLIIKRANGTIQDERTYGNDPFPARG